MKYFKFILWFLLFIPLIIMTPVVLLVIEIMKVMDRLIPDYEKYCKPWR